MILDSEPLRGKGEERKLGRGPRRWAWGRGGSKKKGLWRRKEGLCGKPCEQPEALRTLFPEDRAQGHCCPMVLGQVFEPQGRN